jgi:hypothetical protein
MDWLFTDASAATLTAIIGFGLRAQQRKGDLGTSRMDVYPTSAKSRPIL